MLHQLYSGSACDYFGIVQMVKNEKKGLAIGGIITAVISIVLGIAVSLYAVNIAEKCRTRTVRFISILKSMSRNWKKERVLSSREL